jgi:hypothetical protein
MALLALSSLSGCAAATTPAAPASAAAAPGAAGGPQTLDHPSTPETHRRAVDALFEAIHLRSTLEQGLETTINMQLKANPKLRPFESVMRRFLRKYISYDGLREPMARLYVDRFSELEIVQLTAFYRTPIGQRAALEVPKLMEEGGALGLRIVQEHMDELKEMLRKEMPGE